MSMTWKRVETRYEYDSHKIRGIVWQDGECWRNKVTVGGDCVDMGEWFSREDAMRNCEGGMIRACNLRRFDKNPPTMPKMDDEDA